MIDFIKDNWIIGILSALIIGALGSGLWDVAFKPIFKKLGEALFFVLTFGIKKARDSIYKEAAKGNREQGGIYVARHLSALLSGFLIATCIVFLQVSNKFERHDFEENECRSSSVMSEAHECRKELHEEKLEELDDILSFYVPIAVFMAVILMYSSLWMGFVNRVITDFNQYLAICKPCMSHEDVLNIERDFALMDKKEDLEVILEKLNKIAKSNDLRLPRYSKE